MNTVAKELGIGFAGMGFDPKWPVEARPHMPKVLPALHYYFDKASTFDVDDETYTFRLLLFGVFASSENCSADLAGCSRSS